MKHLTLAALAGAALSLSACADDRSMSSPAMSSTSSAPSVLSPAGAARATPSGIESTGSAGITGGAARPAAGTGVVGRTRVQ